MDPRKERNAINEARKLNIPIVAIVVLTFLWRNTNYLWDERNKPLK